MLETLGFLETAEKISPPPSLPPPSASSTDHEIDVRADRVGQTIYHSNASAAIGTGVDCGLKMRGAGGLRAVDVSVSLVPLSRYIQVSIFAFAEPEPVIMESQLTCTLDVYQFKSVMVSFEE